MEEKCPKPERPKKRYTADRRFELKPTFETYRLEELTPYTPAQKEAAEKLGPKIRIVYCASMYDFACERAKRLVEAGHRPDRIEFVFAERDTLRALDEGRVHALPVDPAEATE